MKRYADHEPYAKIITTSPVRVITKCHGFLDCSVGNNSYFSCCYDGKRWSVLFNNNSGDFALFDKTASNLLHNLLEEKTVRHG